MNLLSSHASKEIRAFDETLGKRIAELRECQLDLNPLSCDVKFLPHLAFIYSLDISNLNEEDSRAYIQHGLDIKRHAGTLEAMSRMFSSLNIEAQVQEWSQYGLEPYHFNIELTTQDREFTLSKVRALRDKLRAVKSARSVLDEMVLAYETNHTGLVQSGSVGESSLRVDMVEGYTNKAQGVSLISGCNAGETSVHVEMVEGYKQSLKSVYTLGASGSVGESYAYATQI